MGAIRFKEHALVLKEYPDILTVDEMSKALGVSTKTGYQLLRENKIEHLKVGRAYKVPKAHLFFLFEVRSAKCGKLKDLHIRILWLKLLQCILSTAEVGATQRRLYLW